jgi:protein arginine kinase
LRYSRAISSQEVVNLSSAVRFGLSLKIDGLASVHTLNELLVRTQPAHLQRTAGREMEQRERNIYRAEYIRRLLEQEGSDASRVN